MDSNPVILTQIDQAKVEGLALAKSDASGMTFFAVTDADDPQVPSIRPKVQLLVAGFAISARSMTSRCTNSICGDIDRGVYCGTDLRQPTALIQAAKDSSPTFALATRS